MGYDPESGTADVEKVNSLSILCNNNYYYAVQHSKCHIFRDSGEVKEYYLLINYHGAYHIAS